MVDGCAWLRMVAPPRFLMVAPWLRPPLRNHQLRGRGHGRIHAIVSLQAIRFAAISSCRYLENWEREPLVYPPFSRSMRPMRTHSAFHRSSEAAGHPNILFASLPIVPLRSASRNLLASGEMAFCGLPALKLH